MKRIGEFLKNFDYKKHLWLIIAGGVFGIYLLLVVLQYAFFYNRFGFFAKIAGVNVGGKTKEQAIQIVSDEWNKYSEKNVKIGAETIVKPKDWTEKVQIEKSVEGSLKKQRNKFTELSVFIGENSSLAIDLNETEATKAIEKENSKIFVPSQNANIEFTPEAKVVPEVYGNEIKSSTALKDISEGFGQMKNDIHLEAEITKPTISFDEATKQIENAKKAISDDIVVTANENKFTISKEEVKNWIKLDRNNAGEITFYDNKKLTEWVSGVAGKVNQKAVNAQLAIKDGRASVFVASKGGYSLDQPGLIEKIQDSATGEKKLEANGTLTKPEITEETINNLGIKELISAGYSDFAGSPANRIHNVKTGASKFNGVIIKPGENFSFNKILGPVDASTGYLEELVILNDKTEKQFGGGLCQVSSTAFRAALNAGFPILERSAHSYPVVYYKPYGVDASIYLPKPDMVFTNDSGQHVLIQTKVVGTRLYFEFYGTKANRTVKFSGNQDGNGAVEIVEKVEPYIYDQEARGRASFSAIFYRHIYDSTGKLTDNDKFTSKYDSPDKYPH